MSDTRSAWRVWGARNSLPHGSGVDLIISGGQDVVTFHLCSLFKTSPLLQHDRVITGEVSSVSIKVNLVGVVLGFGCALNVGVLIVALTVAAAFAVVLALVVGKRFPCASKVARARRHSVACESCATGKGMSIASVVEDWWKERGSGE